MRATWVPAFLVLLTTNWMLLGAEPAPALLKGPGMPTVEEIEKFKSAMHEKYLPRDGDTASLAWGESYALQSFMEMYRATGDAFFLDQLAAHSDRVLACRDDRLKKMDDVRKRVMPGWGSKGYGVNGWHVWVVHSGMLAYPMADFARVILEDQKLHAKYKQKADEYLSAAKEAVDAFDKEWVPTKEAGYYQGPQEPGSPFSGKPLPYNQMNILGTTQLELGRALELKAPGMGKPYLERAEGLARHFKSKLRPGPQPETYVWAYKDGDGGGEDISHAAINIQFVALCHRNGIVFTAEDMRKFSNTFTKIILKRDGHLAATVAGGQTEEVYEAQGGRWLDLAPFDREIWNVCQRLIEARKQYFYLGYAKLLRWK